MSENSREICFIFSFFFFLPIHDTRKIYKDGAGGKIRWGWNEYRSRPIHTSTRSYDPLIPFWFTRRWKCTRRGSGETCRKYKFVVCCRNFHRLRSRYDITRWLKLLAAEIFVTFVRVPRQIYEPFSRLTFFSHGLTRVILEGDKVLRGKLQRKRSVKIDRRSLQSFERGS